MSTLFSSLPALPLPPSALLSLGLSNWMIGLLVTLFFLVCVLLILIVLIQRPQGGGLAGAFGMGAGSSQTAFGAKTGDALTFATIGIFVFYIIAAVGLNYALDPTNAAPTTPEILGTDPASDAVPSPTGGAIGETPSSTPQPITIEPSPAPAVTPAPAITPAPAVPAAPPAEPATDPAPADPAPAQPETPPASPEPDTEPGAEPGTEPGAEPGAEPKPEGN